LENPWKAVEAENNSLVQARIKQNELISPLFVIIRIRVKDTLTNLFSSLLSQNPHPGFTHQLNDFQLVST